VTTEHAAVEEHATNGASRLISRDEANAADREAFLRGEGAEEEAEKPAPAPEPDEDDDAEGVAAEPDEEAPDEEPDDDDGEEAPKGIDKVRHAEQRMRARMAEQQKAFESERDQFIAEWKPKIEKAERLESLIARAKNPFEIVHLAREAGMSEDDMATAGSVLFANSSKGKADPKNAQVIAQSERERQQAERIEKLEARDREREESAKRAEQAANDNARAQAIIDGFVKAVKPERSPLLAAALQNDKEDTHAELGQITIRMIDATGQMPSAKAVHAEFERIEAKRLKRYGVENTAAKTAPTTKAAPTVIKTNGAKTNGTKTEPKTNPSKMDILSELEEMEKNGSLS